MAIIEQEGATPLARLMSTLRAILGDDFFGNPDSTGSPIVAALNLVRLGQVKGDSLTDEQRDAVKERAELAGLGEDYRILFDQNLGNTTWRATAEDAVVLPTLGKSAAEILPLFEQDTDDAASAYTNFASDYIDSQIAAQSSSASSAAGGPGSTLAGSGSSPSAPGGGGGGSGAQIIGGGGGGAGAAGDPGGPVQIPGGAEVWLLDGVHYYLRYLVPGTEVPMLWHIEDPDMLKGIFSGREAKPDRQVTSGDLRNMGALFFGESRELVNTSEHPFDQFLASFEKEAQIRPWLRDPEILALTAMAILEGREVTEGELKTTQWWQTHTDAERQWMALSGSDPSTAAQQASDRRQAVAGELQRLGVTVDDSVIAFIADQWTSGKWSQDRAVQQMRELANPAFAGGLDPELKALVDPFEQSGGLIRSADDTKMAKDMVTAWLGPLAAQQFTEDQLRDWGRAMRASETEVTRFESILSKQFEAMFPEYKGTGAKYQDVAGTTRALFRQTWGEAAYDETDPFFLQVMRTTNLDDAAAMLRQRGLDKGVGSVVNEALSNTLQVSGGQVRRAV